MARRRDGSLPSLDDQIDAFRASPHRWSITEPSDNTSIRFQRDFGSKVRRKDATPFQQTTMYWVGKDIYNPGNTVIRAAEWVDLCHWLDEVRSDPTYLSSQFTTPPIGESTKAEYRIMITYTGINKGSIKTCGDLGRITQMLVSSDKVVLPCCIKTNTCALSKKRKAQTIAVIKKKDWKTLRRGKVVDGNSNCNDNNNDNDNYWQY